MKITWKQYRKACEQSNVEPVRADYKAGEIPSCVLACFEAEPLTMAANA